MSLDYLISPEAREDIDVAHTWYESQATGRGDDFLVEMSEMVATLRTTPELFGRVRGTTRAARLPVSNFVVYYRVEPTRVRVLAVQHASADPKKWRGRR